MSSAVARVEVKPKTETESELDAEVIASMIRDKSEPEPEIAETKETPVQYKWGRCRLRLKELFGEDEGLSYVGQEVTICGWSTTHRKQGAGRLVFVAVKDGSTPVGLQIICKKNDEMVTDGFEESKLASTGSSVCVTGKIIESPGKGQKVELVATKFTLLGYADPTQYPLGKGRHTVEHLRTIQHLRPRTNLIQSVTRISHALSVATHRFFDERGFCYIRTPIISEGDCEGAGEMFSVTTILPKDKEPLPRIPEEILVEETTTVEESITAEDGTEKTVQKKVRQTRAVPHPHAGEVDWSRDFFNKGVGLTVSGQLHVECFAMSMGDVYTFGPTFRAEDSHTSRHLAEFWMVEPEICFANLKDDMDLAEDYIKYCTRYVLETCPHDMAFFDRVVEKGLLARLQNVVDNSFVRITYTEAIELLTQPQHLKKGKFERKPEWGIDLGSEHERYLTEKIFKCPVIVTDYPAKIKAFYMKLNEDEKTVRAMDILVPGIGELVGGSERESDEKILLAKMEMLGVDPETIPWYVDLRRFGTAPHAGFGVGFDRLIMYMTGIQNIREAIPFPRYPGHAEV